MLFTHRAGRAEAPRMPRAMAAMTWALSGGCGNRLYPQESDLVTATRTTDALDPAHPPGGQGHMGEGPSAGRG